MSTIYMLRKVSLSVAVLALLIILADCRQGYPTGQSPDISAQQTLATAVGKFMRWKSYRYKGTSTLAVSGRPGLSNKGAFDTRLQINAEGAMDGHMVVESPGGSYETYTCNRIVYKKLKGGDWHRNSRGARILGTGMVSLGARRIIAAFADLVEDVRFVRVNEQEYVITCIMGEKYNAGAQRIARAGKPGHEHAAPDAKKPGVPAKGTVMHLTLDRKTLEMKRVWMKDSQSNPGIAGTITTITEGTYTEINQPQAVKPVPEALNAHEETE